MQQNSNISTSINFHDIKCFLYQIHLAEPRVMLPDKAADAAVLWDCLEGAVLALIHSHGATDGHIVDGARDSW